MDFTVAASVLHSWKTGLLWLVLHNVDMLMLLVLLMCMCVAAGV